MTNGRRVDHTLEHMCCRIRTLCESVQSETEKDILDSHTDEILHLAQGVIERGGSDRSARCVAYSAVKLLVHRKSRPENVLPCSLDLFEVSMRALGPYSTGMEPESSPSAGDDVALAVGALISAGMALADCIVQGQVDVASQHLNSMLHGVQKAWIVLFRDTRTSRKSEETAKRKSKREQADFVDADKASRDNSMVGDEEKAMESYAMTLFKTLHKSAIGFFQNGKEMECYKICQHGMCSGIYPAVLPRALKAVAALAAHFKSKDRAIGVLCSLLRQTESMIIQNSVLNPIEEQNSEIWKAFAECLSSLRRIVAEHTCAESRVWKQEHPKDVILAMLRSVSLMCRFNDQGDVLHSAAASLLVSCNLLGLLRSDLEFEEIEGKEGMLSKAISAFIGVEFIDDIFSNDSNEKIAERWRTCENCKDLRWLSASLYNRSLEQLASDCAFMNVNACHSAWSSIMLGICHDRVTESIARSDSVEEKCVDHASRMGALIKARSRLGENDGPLAQFLDDMSNKTVLYYAEVEGDRGYDLGRIVRHVVRNSWSQDNQSSLTQSILQMKPKRKKESMHVVGLIAKYEVLARCKLAKREEDCETRGWMISSLGAFTDYLLKDAFSPDKYSKEHMAILYVCWQFKDLLSDLVHLDDHRRSMEEALVKTKTKIGKKRIEDVHLSLLILRDLQELNRLVQEGISSQQKNLESRRIQLAKDPSLIHADQLQSYEEQYVSHVEQTRNAWKQGIDSLQDTMSRLKSRDEIPNALIADVTAVIELHVPLHDHKSCFGVMSILHGQSDNNAPHDESSEWLIEDPSKVRPSSAFYRAKSNLFDSYTACDEGDLKTALFHAMEAHKVTSPYMSNCHHDEVCAESCWSFMGEYLAITSHLGFLFGVCGLYEEAMQSLREGLRLASVICSPLYCLHFILNMCDLFIFAGLEDKVHEKLTEVGRLVKACTEENLSSPVGLHLQAHVEVIKAHVDRKSLQFTSALLHVHRVPEILYSVDTTSRYRNRISCLAELERIKVIVDDSSTDTALVLEDLTASLQACSGYNASCMQAAPLSSGIAMAEQRVMYCRMISKPYFSRKNSKRSHIWIREGPEYNEEDALLLGPLWENYVATSSTPSCQRIISLILAPICASLGYISTSLVLLHSSSNATLHFQHDMIAYTRVRQKASKGSIECLNDSSLATGISIEEYLSHKDAAKQVIKVDMSGIEAKAAKILALWVEALPSELVLCGISVYNKSIFGSFEDLRDTMVFYRVRSGQAPVILQVFGPESKSSHPIHGLHGAKETGPIRVLTDSLESLLAESNKNMRNISRAPSEKEQREWWRERLHLDESLREILEELGNTWIGPWRALFTDTRADYNAINSQLGIDNGDQNLSVSSMIQLLALLVSTADSMGEAESQECFAVIKDAAQSLGYEHESIKEIFSNEGIQQAFRNQDDGSLCRKVSWEDEKDNDICKAFLNLQCEVGTVMRSNDVENMTEQFSGVHLQPSEQCQMTPGPNQAHATPQTTRLGKKKHKSRLTRMYSLATPAQPKALAPYNRLEEARHPFSTAVKKTQPAAKIFEPNTEPRHKIKQNRTKLHQDQNGDAVQVALILDHSVQALPWETAFGLMGHGINNDLYRIPSLPCFASTSRKDTISLHSCYYSINPSGDLTSTQATFEDWFKGIPGWTGTAGSPPDAKELAKELQTKDLFVYCGHGGGEQYISIPRLRSLGTCASALLMGCSSGRLKWHADGLFEPYGIVLSYVLAGCPTAIANLWDVTDRDIDRFCQAVLTKWLSKASLPSTRTGQIVHDARDACKLRHLIGAAPVCYGLPTTLVKSKMECI